VRREPNDADSPLRTPGIDDGAHGEGRQIVLPDVDAIRTREPRDVRTIVHDEERVRRVRSVHDGRREVEEFAGRETFGAELKERRPAREEGPRQIERLPPSALGDIDINNGIED
jgi:hypothetical protein